MEYFGLKLGQDLGNRAAHPYQEFRGVPPPPPGNKTKTLIKCCLLRSFTERLILCTLYHKTIDHKQSQILLRSYQFVQFSDKRDLKHRRRGRQRERQKTIVLISKTLAPHVHYTLWYISLPCSPKQRREMTKFKVLWRT